jgi:dGTPase
MIDYTKKITLDREFYPSNDINYSIESDRGRILSSAAFRRLQKRTQVFALELNASIRSRLTHSLEVAQTARYIARTILEELEKDTLESYKLEEFQHAFVSLSEMTSLLHDIGNPPFGHFAEQTMNKWIENNAFEILDKLEASTKETQVLKNIIKNDIANYDGNAQAIRIITKLQRLNLSYTQVLSVLKYTRGAYEDKPKDGAFNYLKKKPGFYFSEAELIKNLQEKLEVEQGHRFPITYIMEAADDISYLTADLEDAVEKGILTLDTVYTLIVDECKKKDESYLIGVIQKRYEQAKKNDEPYVFNMFFTLIRATLVGDLVKHVAKIYVDNHEAVFNGSFDAALLEYDKESKYYKAIEILQDISYKYIYQHPEVQELELQGYAIINTLLDIYKPLLELTSEDFTKLLDGKTIDCFVSMRLIKRISSKQIVAYKSDVNNLDKNLEEKFILLEWYFRVRLIIDYISGMTDDFALHEYKLLTATK